MAGSAFDPIFFISLNRKFNIVQYFTFCARAAGDYLIYCNILPLRSGRAGPSFLYGQKGSKEPIKGNPFDGFPLAVLSPISVRTEMGCPRGMSGKVRFCRKLDRRYRCFESRLFRS